MDFNRTEQKIKLSFYIWIFLIVELISLILIAYYVLSPQKTASDSSDKGIIMLYLSYLFVLGAIPLSFYINKIMSKKSKKENSLNKRTQIYYNSIIARLSILEFAGVFSLIAFYISSYTEPLYMYGIVFIAVLLTKPSFHSFKTEYSKAEETDIFEEEQILDKNH